MRGNAWIESFNGRMRDEFLNGVQFGGFFEAQVLTEAWRIDYNNHRPRPARCWLTPVGFAGRWVHRQQPQLA
jgi:putative transposase